MYFLSVIKGFKGILMSLGHFLVFFLEEHYVFGRRLYGTLFPSHIGFATIYWLVPIIFWIGSIFVWNITGFHKPCKEKRTKIEWKAQIPQK